MSGLKKIWENRKQITEGILNNTFKKADVEIVATKRLAICKACPHIDLEGSTCVVPGTQPCCSLCGCCLDYKARALSSACEDPEGARWDALLSQEEEDEFNSKE